MRAHAKRFLVAALAITAAVALAAKVNMNVGALQNPNPDNDGECFLHMVNQKFPQKQETVSAIFHELKDPVDEYTQLAFIAGKGNTDLKTVLDYKKKEHGWFETMKHFGVAPSMLFVDVPTPPAKQYGGAYGTWRKKGDKIGGEEMGGKDIIYWAGVQSIAAFSGKAPGDVVAMANGGETLQAISGRLYREKTGKGTKGTQPVPAAKKDKKG